VVGGQWSVVSGQWSVVSGQWSVVSGRWPVAGGQRSVVSGQRPSSSSHLATDHRPLVLLTTDHRPLLLAAAFSIEELLQLIEFLASLSMFSFGGESFVIGEKLLSFALKTLDLGGVRLRFVC